MPRISLRGYLIPVNSFLIGGRCLCLYIIHSDKKSANYSLYWTGEENPVQHGMTDREVFNVIAHELEKVGEKTEKDVQPKHIASAKKKPAPPPGWIGGPWGRDHKDVEVKPKGIKEVKDQPQLRKDPPIRPLALGDSLDPDQEERSKF